MKRMMKKTIRTQDKTQNKEYKHRHRMQIPKTIPSVIVYKIMGFVAMPFSYELELLFAVENVCRQWHAQRGVVGSGKEHFSCTRILRRVRNERALLAYMGK